MRERGFFPSLFFEIYCFPLLLGEGEGEVDVFCHEWIDFLCVAGV